MSTQTERRYIVGKISWLHGREPVKEFPTREEAEQFIQTNDGAAKLHITPVEMSKEDWSNPDISKMGVRIVLFVHSRPTATFAELTQHLGEAASGDCNMCLGPHKNLVLWSDVSDLFINAFNAIKPMLFEEPSHFMVYAMDGQVLTLPIATRLDHNEPHWVPMVLSIRTKEHQKKIDEAKRRNEQREARRRKRDAARTGEAA